jgi:hypothetical protein
LWESRRPHRHADSAIDFRGNVSGGRAFLQNRDAEASCASVKSENVPPSRQFTARATAAPALSGEAAFQDNSVRLSAPPRLAWDRYLK